MARDGGDGGGEGDGHEAEALALEELHGGAHVLLHELRHLVLRHRQAVAGRPIAVPSSAVRLHTVATSSLCRTIKRLLFHDRENSINEHARCVLACRFVSPSRTLPSSGS